MNDLVWKNKVDESHEPVFLIKKISGEVKYANKSARKIFPQLVRLGKAKILFNELNTFSEHAINGHIFQKIKTVIGKDEIVCSIDLEESSGKLILSNYQNEAFVIIRIVVADVDNSHLLTDDTFDYLAIINSMVEGVNQLPFHKYDALISDSLEKIGQYFKCERVYLFNYSEDEKFVSMVQQWTHEEVIPFSEWKDIPLVHFNHVGGSLLNNKVYCINTLTDIPDSAEAERHGMMAEGVKSVLLISFKNKKHTMGFVGIDMVSEERRWTSDEVEKLSLFSSLVGNIQVKQHEFLRENSHNAMASMLFEESAWATGIFKDEKLVDCNNQALSLLKAKKHEIIGKSVYELTFSEGKDRTKVERNLNILIEQSKNGAVPVSHWNVNKIDGSFERVELTFKTFEFDGINYLAISAKDIREQIEKEAALLKTQKSLESKLDTILSPSKRINKVKLLDLLNKEQLFTLTKAFSDATGLASAILDEEGNQISSVLTNNRVCDLVLGTIKGKEVCVLSDKLLVTRVKESLQPEWQHCLSCSFLDAIAPIIVNDKLVGSWRIGRALPHDADMNRVLKFGGKLGIDNTELKNAFNQQKRIGRKEFENSLHLLCVLANELSNLAFNNLKLAKSIKSHQRMEKRLEKARLRAEESDRLKSAFLANMSHEIRTPMNGIVGFSELIQSPDVEANDRSNYISIIQESSNQLLNIINDIIDISKIEAGQIDVNYESVNIKELMDELLLFYGSIAQQKRINLLMDFPLDKTLCLNVDRTKLKQVFSNLIGNAIKFTYQGYVQFGCYIYDEEQFGFYVKDTGIGIEEMDQQRIFNRFWQVGKNSSNSGGTGLGLTITKAYVELMGGKIWLTSELEKGTQFNFTIEKT